MRLYQKVDYGLGNDGIQRMKILGILALFILLISCINFANLTTARFARRAQEVGIRKVVGAHRMQLARQFLGEAMLVSFVSLGFALILAELALQPFNGFVDKSLSLTTLIVPHRPGSARSSAGNGTAARQLPGTLPIRLPACGSPERKPWTWHAGHGDERWRMQILRVDKDFLPLFGIELLAGRNFSAEIGSDQCES